MDIAPNVTLTAEEYRAWLQIEAKRRSKYGNEPVVIDGVRFDSTGEARRWGELLLLQRAGQIANLRRQVRYPLRVNGEHICDYVADFVYQEDGALVVEDYKGFRTPIYRLKRALMRACHGIVIRETGTEKE